LKIEPITSYKKKNHALLTPGNRELLVETVNGSQRFSGKRDIELALLQLKGYVCYVSSGLQRMKATTGATEWVLNTWRGREVKMTHTPSGVVVTSLRGTLEMATDTFSALTETLTWLSSYAIAPGPISSMSWNLLRASMNQTITIGFDYNISGPAFFGGRQQIQQPGTYRDMKSLDIKAAYPSAMAARPVALSLREVAASTTIDPEIPGLARAIVNVPEWLEYPPLPVRVDTNAIQFQWGKLEGTWTWVELAAAQALGCDVEILKSWAPRRTFDLFGPWWELAQEGRELSRPAANLAKAIANSTWGQFAMKGDQRSEIQWVDDRGNIPFEIETPTRIMPHQFAVHVASEVTSRVRVQTLIEGMYAIKTPSIHVDTDGIIVDNKSTLPANFGPGFGEWNIKAEMKTIDVRGPQFYRYQVPGSSDWHYVASGMNESQAAAMYLRNQTVSTHISYLAYNDACLPPANAHDQETINRLLSQYHSLGV